MFNTNKIDFLRPITCKHKPFSDIPTDTSKTPSDERKQFEAYCAAKGIPVKPVGKKFTYQNHRGAALTLQKKKYSWTDPNKYDDKGKLVGERKEVELKAESAGVYNFEEYERNEFERIAIAEGWPVDHLLQEMPTLSDEIETEMKNLQKTMEATAQKQQDINMKLDTVIQNYASLHSTYSHVRMEIQAMAIELPALKGTPFDKPYFEALTPIVENMAKVHFPQMVKDPVTVVVPAETPAKETAK